jgi:LDH2 family malate/lactate/ureidoglycolate dehydrogenase
LLVGVLTGAKMGLEVGGEYDLGAVFLAVDPGVLVPGGDPGAAAERLIDSVRASRPAPGHDAVLAPGDRAAARREAARAGGVVEVDPATMAGLRRMAVSDEGGLEPSDRLN